MFFYACRSSRIQYWSNKYLLNVHEWYTYGHIQEEEIILSAFRSVMDRESCLNMLDVKCPSRKSLGYIRKCMYANFTQYYCINRFKRVEEVNTFTCCRVIFRLLKIYFNEIFMILWFWSAFDVTLKTRDLITCKW